MTPMDPLVLALLAAAAVLAQPNYRYSCIYYCQAGGYGRVQPLVYCCWAAFLHHSHHTPGAGIPDGLPSGPECPPARTRCPMHNLRIGRPPLSCEKDADCAYNEKCCVDDCVNQRVCTMAVQRPSQHTCLPCLVSSACSHDAGAARTSDGETDESSRDDENDFIYVKGNHNSVKDNTDSFKNDRASIMSQDGDHTRENGLGYARFSDAIDNLLDNYDLDYDYYDTDFHIPL